MKLIEPQFLPDPTWVYFDQDDLVLEFRNIEQGKGVILRVHRGQYQCYKIEFDKEYGAWTQATIPMNLPVKDVLEWFEENYQPDTV